MKGSLKIEAIGDNIHQDLRFYKNLTNEIVPGLGDVTFGSIKKGYWVAEITGPDPKYKYKRVFLRGKKDYKKANSKGSRGIFIYYLLESDHIYEVLKPISWKNSKRFFCTVDEDGNIIEVDREYVDRWINERSE